MNKRIDTEAFGGVIEKTLKTGKPLHLKVSGHSMAPLFKNRRTSVILKPKETIRRFDVALFESGGRYFLHRVIKIAGDALYTRGDFNTVYDPPIESSDVLGIVTHYGVKRMKSMDRKAQRAYARLWHMLGPLRTITIKLIRKARRMKDAK